MAVDSTEVETAYGIINQSEGIDLECLASDLSLEASGVWREYFPGVELLVASTHQRAYQRDIAKVLRLNDAKFRDANTTTEERARVLAPVVAEHLLRGWRGITVGGQPLPYTKAKATEILSDPKFHRLYDFVIETARAAEAFRRQREDVATGN